MQNKNFISLFGRLVLKLIQSIQTKHHFTPLLLVEKVSEKKYK